MQAFIKMISNDPKMSQKKKKKIEYCEGHHTENESCRSFQATAQSNKVWHLC